DYLQLTHDALGRRTDAQRPEEGLILQKATGRVPHEGGRRFGPASSAAAILRAWQAEGRRDDPPNLPALTALQGTPRPPVLPALARAQQLAVRARFADGSAADVTRLTVYSSSEPAIARTQDTGLVEFSRPGEVAVLCRYQGQVVSVRLAHLRVPDGFAWPS